MSEKHRSLPLWMVKSDDQSSKVNKKETVRKKTQGGTARKKRPRSAITYWMNEKELVETALCFLKDSKLCTKGAIVTSNVEMVIPETDSSDCEARDRTYVSDTDCEIAEQETVPYGNCTSEGTSSHMKPHTDDSGTSEKMLRLQEPSHKPDDSDDEALELVREVFFT
nr:uncharacterized protein si:ch211-127m7.2 [Misgurnus anguillicaudatus]